MPDLLHIANHGPLVVSSNYWDTEHAARGPMTAPRNPKHPGGRPPKKPHPRASGATQTTMKNQLQQKPWTTRPISCTCEVERVGKVCGLPTDRAYPAHGGGWIALCYRHGLRHSEATPTDVLIAKGETLG